MRKDYHRFLDILKKYDKELHQAAVLTLEKDDLKGDNRVIKQTTATASGPILFEYIWWTLRKAKEDGIRRLYFLARDGYVMYQIANIICEKFQLDIECCYLYCSRIAWRLPQYHLQKEACLNKICLMGIDITLDKILERGSLNSKEKQEVYKRLEISDGEELKILSRLEIAEYRSKLEHCEGFLETVYAHSKKAYAATMGYLEQMGLLEDIPYAIVDTGWTGSMQESLNELLQSKGKAEKVKGFYFGIYNLPDSLDPNDVSAFFFAKKEQKKHKVYFNNCLFECLCGAMDGMTIRYELQEEKYVPVFYTKSNRNVECWDLEGQIEVLLCYARNAAEQIQFADYQHNKSLMLVHKLCKAFMTFPTRDEANCYGDYIFSDDVTEKHVQKIAVEMTEREIRENHVVPKIMVSFGLKKMSTWYRQTCWLEGSVAREKRRYEGYHKLNTVLYKWMLYIIQS